MFTNDKQLLESAMEMTERPEVVLGIICGTSGWRRKKVIKILCSIRRIASMYCTKKRVVGLRNKARDEYERNGINPMYY